MNTPKKFDKTKARSDLFRFNTDITGIIYNGLTHQTSKWTVMRQISNEVRVLSSRIGPFSPILLQKLYAQMYKIYQKTAKRAFVEARKDKKRLDYKENLEIRSESVYSAVKKLIINDRSILKIGNPLLNALESKDKHVRNEEMLQDARDQATEVAKSVQKLTRSGQDIPKVYQEFHYSPFYLASAHVNCAKDHEPLQGRMYYDKKWEKYVTSPEDAAKIRAYIQNHRCLSVQESLEAPYWFITRCNCTHYFKHMSLEETLGSSCRKLLKTHHMIKHKVNMSPTITYANAYKEKVEDLSSLWQIMPNKNIAKDLKQTKKLYKKWNKIAQNQSTYSHL